MLSATNAWVFDLTGRLRFMLRQAAEVKFATYNDSGQLLLTACSNEQFTECAAQVWNASTGDPIGRPIKHKDGVLSAAFSPDSRQVVSASEDFTALISEIYGAAQPRVLAHDHQVRTACFSPAGSRVLTVGGTVSRVSGTPIPASRSLPGFHTLLTFGWDDSLMTQSSPSRTVKLQLGFGNFTLLASLWKISLPGRGC